MNPTTTDAPPAIVLVRPQMGENIGAAARVMSNFGLSDLRIVAPRDGWPNEKATAMAAHGAPLLDTAHIYPTLPEALHGIANVYATTATRRDMQTPLLTPRTLFAQQHSAETSPRRAILFGPERAGLTNEDLVHAHAIVEITTCTKNPSLNLAQAVCVIAYEYWMQRPAHATPQREPYPQADAPALQGYFDQLEVALDARGYFREPHKKTLMWQHLRGLFIKAKLTEQDVRTLRGVVRALTRSV